MRQLLQNIKDGTRSLVDVAVPVALRGHVVIAQQRSLISAGTEKMVMDLAKKSLIGKAKARPDHVRRVIEKVRNEGLIETYRQVSEKLDDPMPMGYSSSGVVIEVGAGVQKYKPGDRVASNGPHAEVVCVPEHLVARLPDNVTDEQGAFTVLGAIAIQGVRLSQAVLGETVLVIGLGLVGQLTVALLNAAGCRVIGTDPDPSKCELAEKMGASVARTNLGMTSVQELTGGAGADSVIIAASTESNGPIELAAAAVRQKGRVVLVGVIGLQLDRRPFYFKEAEFVVSCSYGPGRYDPEYEDRGHDYPVGYVRWTEQRNMQAVVDLISAQKLDVFPLISHRISFDQVESAYDLLEKNTEPFLGILLEYPNTKLTQIQRRPVKLRDVPTNKGIVGVGVLGAGNFARMVLIPKIVAFKDARPVVLCSAGGVSASHIGKKRQFEIATTNEDDVFDNEDVDVIFSITRHDLHAQHVLRAIRTRKAIFVEKPLCLTVEELIEIEASLDEAGEMAPPIMVGFNRRFSPAAEKVRHYFSGIEAPLMLSYRFNAGAIESTHWTQHPLEGGGRIVGEACHAIDFATFILGSPVCRVYAESIGGPNAPEITEDQCFITCRHVNDSISNICYTAGGDKGFPKERIEVFGGGQMAVIEDFHTVITSQSGKIRRHKMGGQNKGHQEEIERWLTTIRDGGPIPIPWEEIRSTTLAAILACQSIRTGKPVSINDVEFDVKPPAAQS